MWSATVFTDVERTAIAGLAASQASSPGAVRKVEPAGDDRITALDVETAFVTTIPITVDQMVAAARLDITALVKIVSVNGADTTDLAVRLGGLAGTLILSLGATAFSASDFVLFECSIFFDSVGAGGKYHLVAKVSQKVAGVYSELGTVELDGAIDTTVDRDVTITATQSAAHANNKADLRLLEARIAKTA